MGNLVAKGVFRVTRSTRVFSFVWIQEFFNQNMKIFYLAWLHIQHVWNSVTYQHFTWNSENGKTNSNILYSRVTSAFSFPAAHVVWVLLKSLLISTPQTNEIIFVFIVSKPNKEMIRRWYRVQVKFCTVVLELVFTAFYIKPSAGLAGYFCFDALPSPGAVISQT